MTRRRVALVVVDYVDLARWLHLPEDTTVEAVREDDRNSGRMLVRIVGPTCPLIHRGGAIPIVNPEDL